MNPSNIMTNTVVYRDWHSTAEGETILQYFYDPQSSGRKLFGVLERPAVPSNIEEVSYKLFVVGKTGVGKTSTVARFAGLPFSCAYNETPGIKKTNVYWPVKIWEKVIVFKLQFWEAGDNSIKKYSHILSECREKADGILFLFSYTDTSSFNELPQLISKMTLGPDQPAKAVIGTKFSSNSKLDVTSAQTRDFELKWKVPVLCINKWTNDRNEVHKVAPLLNTICELLWIRDQDYLLKQGLAT